MAIVDKAFGVFRKYQERQRQKQVDAEYAVYQRALTAAENALNRPYFRMVKSPKNPITDPSIYIKERISRIVDVIAEKVNEGVDVRIAEPLEALFEKEINERGYVCLALITDYKRAEKITWYSVAKNQTILKFRESKR